MEPERAHTYANISKRRGRALFISRKEPRALRRRPETAPAAAGGTVSGRRLIGLLLRSLVGKDPAEKLRSREAERLSLRRGRSAVPARAKRAVR